jgi:hypothetical protein
MYLKFKNHSDFDPNSSSLFGRFSCEQFYESVFFNFYFSDGSHLLFSFCLIGQKLHLPPDVATIALRRHVLSVRLQVLARQHSGVDCGLQQNIRGLRIGHAKRGENYFLDKLGQWREIIKFYFR